MQPLGDRPTKICPKCEKKKDLEYGYYKDPSTASGYHSWCKVCMKDYSTEYEHKKKDYTFKHHLWEEFDKYNQQECKRCGLLKKREPHIWKLGKWVFLYYVNKEWTLDKQPCIRKDKQDDSKMDIAEPIRLLCESGG